MEGGVHSAGSGQDIAFLKNDYAQKHIGVLGIEPVVFTDEDTSNKSIVKYAGWHIDWLDGYVTVEFGARDMSELNLALIKSNIPPSFFRLSSQFLINYFRN
jgi:hypothetical protein